MYSYVDDVTSQYDLDHLKAANMEHILKAGFQLKPGGRSPRTDGKMKAEAMTVVLPDQMGDDNKVLGGRALCHDFS